MNLDQMTERIRLPGWVRDHLPDRTEGIWVVGGTVRDILAGRRSADIDLVARGDIARVAAQIAHRTGGRVVDIGKKGFAVLRVASPEAIVDITPLKEASIEADLAQRDFTINALAYDVHARRLVDCTGGRRDMQAGIIRLVAPTALRRDPARLVRAYRLAAVLQFSIDPDTQAAIGRHRLLLSGVAGERIWAELVKLFQADRSAAVLRCMADNGLLTAVFPELLPAVGCTQNQYHAFDVFEHSLRAYGHLEDLLAVFDARFAHLQSIADRADLSGRTVPLKYACLLHDVGKPAARTVDAAGRVHFYGHASRSAEIAAGVSRRLRLSRSQRDTADAVIRHHIRPLFLYLALQKGSLGRRGMVRFFNHAGDLTVAIVVHAIADIMAKGSDLHDRDRGFIAYCDRLLADYDAICRRRAATPRLIDGHDLIAVFGLSPSPLFRRLLDRVDEGRLAGELTTREQALAWVADFLRTDDGRRKTEVGGPRMEDRGRRSEK